MKQTRSGFTIVEIALVLGIAGLIFIMAFIALPSLWASQRDADRKARVMEFISDIKTYQTNNRRGALPTSAGEYEVIKWSEATDSGTDWKGFIKDYVDPNFEDPSGIKYTFYITWCKKSDGGEQSVGAACTYGPATGTNEDGEPIVGLEKANTELESPLYYTIYVAIGAVCDGNQMVKASNNRSVAALQILERAGQYCYNT